MIRKYQNDFFAELFYKKDDCKNNVLNLNQETEIQS